MRRAETGSALRVPPVEIGLVALMGGLYLLYGLNINWVFDDSFFFVRYARNILDGHGYTWNPGAPPMDGLTSPLWMMLVLLALPFVSEEAAATGPLLGWMSNGFSLLLLVVIYGAVRWILPEGRRPFALLAPLLLVASPLSIAGISNTGMETAMVSALLVVYTALLGWWWASGRLASVGWRGLTGACLLGFLLVPARPEFGLVAIGSPALLALLTWRSDPAAARRAALLAGIVAAAIGCYGVVRWLVFGYFFPLPFYVKGSFWASPYDDYSPFMRDVLMQFPLFFLRDSIVLHFAVIYSLMRSGRVWELLWLWGPLYLAMAYLSTTLQIMGYSHRYYFPFACALMVVVALCWREKDGAAVAGRDVYIPVAVVAGLLFLAYGLLPQAQVRSHNPGEDAMHPRVARLVRGLPAGTSIAATETGILSAMNPGLVIHDCAGLNDPEFARGFDAEVLFARRPDIITLIHGHYGGMTRAIREHPDFADFHAVVNLTPDREDTYLDTTIQVNRNSPRYDEIVAILQNARE